MNLLGWGRGETWKWRRRLFVWEEELVGECCALLNSFVLQADVDDRLLWLSHMSLKSATLAVLILIYYQRIIILSKRTQI